MNYGIKINKYENYPKGFSMDYIYNILLQEENKDFADKWKKWTEGFIEMHSNS